MQVLFPPSGEREVDDDRLVELYAYPDGQVWVRANMVSSLDGAVTGADERSGSLSTAADRRVFSVLRGLCDVVLVGAGTARAEGYGPAKVAGRRAALRARSGLRDLPVIALVSASLDLDPAAPVFAEATERTVVVTHAAAPADRRASLETVADVVVAGRDRVDVPAALAALAERGLHRVLCEGGPRLLAAVADAEALDELCVTLAPRLVGGDAGRIVSGPPVDLPLRLAHLLEEDGTLLARWVRA
ncbi:MAG TPA: pyrimidine reductase family protein [Jiangellales bacterium]|nr:pyrimidine reductase family protein [Jiangellales bacterium]